MKHNWINVADNSDYESYKCLECGAHTTVHYTQTPSGECEKKGKKK